MGMFDWVAFEMDCPKCTKPVRGFQSKDGPCGLDVLLPWTVDNFYSRCEACDSKIDFHRGKMITPSYDAGCHWLPFPPDGKAKPT